MSAKHIFPLAFFMIMLGFFHVKGQERTEKIVERSSCFSSKIEISVSHCSIGNADGSITVDLPKSVSDARLFWFGHRLTKEAKNLTGLEPGYYSVLILDDNNCKTKVDNIQVKEVQ